MNTADFSRVKIDIPDIGFDELHVMKNAPERIYDVAWRKIAGGYFVQHRREQNEILAADQCCLHVRPASQLFVQIHGGVQPGKSAAQNDDFVFFHWLFLSVDWLIFIPVGKLTGFEPFLRSPISL